MILLKLLKSICLNWFIYTIWYVLKARCLLPILRKSKSLCSLSAFDRSKGNYSCQILWFRDFPRQNLDGYWSTRSFTFRSLVNSLLDINKVEAVQRRAARWVTNNYSSYSSVTQMINSLGWRSLEQRRADARLIMFYKINLTRKLNDSFYWPVKMI